jgi:hypothetical protein
MDVQANPVAPRRDGYVSLARATGVIGIGFVVLLFGSTIAISTAGEPGLEATAEEAAAYFGTADAAWVEFAHAVQAFGMMGSLWFFVAFGQLLRRAEGEPPWRSTIAMLSGGLLAAFGLIDTSWAAAALHGNSISPGVADYAYAVSQLGFANAWVALASFAICSGWVILATGLFGRWMGWWAVVAGIGLALSRFVWATGAWGIPYALFWLWIITVSIRLLRRPAEVAQLPPQEASA